jgi:uncharacterized delta-60 repeat protein
LTGAAVLLAGLALLLGLVAGGAHAAGGQLDTSFSGDGKKTVSVGSGATGDIGNAVAVQGDGKVLVVGLNNNAGGTDANCAIVRLKANGRVDRTFSGDGRKLISFENGTNTDDCNGVAVQSNGQIVVAGRSDQGAGQETDMAVARLLSNGAFDHSFSGDGKKTLSFPNSLGDEAEEVAIAPNGRIVLLGFSDQPTTGSDFAIAVLRSGGKPDPSFDGDGRRTLAFDNATGDSEEGDGLIVQDDGKIVVAGTREVGAAQDFAVARFGPHGGLDHTFSGDGKRTVSFTPTSDDEANVAAIDPRGRILLAGDVSTANGCGVLRLTPAGNPDHHFSGNGRKEVVFPGGAASGCEALAVQDNSRVVIGAVAGTGVFATARLLSNGALDDTFSGDGTRLESFPGFTAAVARSAAAPHGRIIVAGDVSDGTSSDFAVARYLAG